MASETKHFKCPSCESECAREHEDSGPPLNIIPPPSPYVCPDVIVHPHGNPVRGPTCENCQHRMFPHDYECTNCKGRFCEKCCFI